MAKGGRRNGSGRKKKPTDLKVLQGTFRDDRHGDEVRVAASWPAAPAHLNARERELWAELEGLCREWVAPSDVFAINGVVSLVDRLLLVQAAQRVTPDASNPLALKFTPAADGEPNAEPKENPLFGMEIKLWRELRAYIGITGLSPVDRARVHKAGGDEKPASKLRRFMTHG
jgi:hypothetical protein